MASKEPEEPSNTETEEETLALKKKRARRVSFADVEITSVHIFNRDDEYETPPDTQASSGTPPADNEVLGFFGDLADSDDSRESSPTVDDDREDVEPRKSFFRPIGSPSPGSSTAGSVTSNDEDNFFGPVSASFIRPGRLSESAASDENHDLTMDSTAFSMHFRSLARSDSGGDLKTPTAVRLAFEEKTPNPSATPDNPESLMALTKAKKLSLEPVTLASDGKDSNDMSIVGENSRVYDYGRLSPTLDALLTEGSKDLYAISVTEKSSKDTTNASGAGEMIGNDHLDEHVSGDTEMGKRRRKYSKNEFEMSNPELQATASNSGRPSDMNSTDHLNFFAGENLSDGWAKKSSPKGRIYRTDNNHSYIPQYVSPVKGSILSLSATQQILSGTPSLFGHVQALTPNSKQSDHSVSKERTKDGEGVSSIHKSISKFGLPSPSPCDSSLKEGISKLRSRLSSYPSMKSMSSVPSDTSKVEEIKDVAIPTAHLEQNISSNNLNNGEYESLISIDTLGIETPRYRNKLNQNEAIREEVGESLCFVSMGSLSKEKPSRSIIEADSPFQVTWSGKGKGMQHLLTSENSIEARPIAPTDTSSVDGRPDNRTNDDKLVSSPIKSQDKGVITSTNCQDSLSHELTQWDQLSKPVCTGSRQDGDATENATGISHLTSMVGRLDSLQFESEKESSFMNFQTASGDRVIMNSQFRSPNKSLKVVAESSPYIPNARRSVELSHQKSPSERVVIQSLTRKETGRSPYNQKPTEIPTWKESMQSPSKKESAQGPNREESTPSRSMPDDIRSYVERDILFSESKSCGFGNHGDYEGHHKSQGYPALDIDNISGRKRRNIDMVPLDGDCEDIIDRIQRSPKVCKKGSYDSDFLREQSNQPNNAQKIRGHTTWKHADVHAMSVKFSADTEDLLPAVVDELNLKVIDRLEDTFVHLSTVNKYAMLSSEILSQKIAQQASVRHKRVAEARSLMCKIAYEKAIVQLMIVKHKGYQKRAQLLSSQTQELQMLKLNYCHLSEPGVRHTRGDDSSQSHSVVSENKHEVSRDRVRTMRQEFESLDRKVKSLSKYLSTYCKLKGEPSPTDTNAFVHDHLKKRQCRRFISQDLQLWEVDDFDRRDGHYSILLNYLGYISQRYTIKTGPVSSITISNELNNTNILKNFPNMNVCAAFAFVLDIDTIKKCVNSRYLSQETQITSSLLRNLLDVVEEVELAQIEITNMIQTSFFSPSDEQLHLQLCFINFHSGMKLTLTLDMSSLNRGVYPSEIIPYKVDASSRSQCSLSKSLLTDVRMAVANLRVGYSRILRLCRSVSEILEASSR